MIHPTLDQLDELASADDDLDREIVRAWQWATSELGSGQLGDFTEYIDALRAAQERIHKFLVDVERLKS